MQFPIGRVDVSPRNSAQVSADYVWHSRAANLRVMKEATLFAPFKGR
jgi:hypothetical protein